MRLRHQSLIKILRFLYKLHHLGFNSVLQVIERLCLFASFFYVVDLGCS